MYGVVASRLRTTTDAALRRDLAYVDALVATTPERPAVRHGPAALPGLNLIAERHHLTWLDRDLLLLASASEISAAYAPQSVGSALAAFDQRDLSRELLLSRLVGGSPLLVNGLVELDDDRAFASRRLAVPDIVWQRMLGIASERPAVATPDLLGAPAALDTLAVELRIASGVIAIRGSVESGRTGIAAALANRLGKTILELDIAMPIEIVVREARWANAIPVFAAVPLNLAAIAMHCPHVIVILEPMQRLPLEVAGPRFELVTQPLDRVTRDALWTRELGELGELDAVTNLYEFGPERIRMASAMAKRNKPLTREHLLTACQAVTRTATFTLATPLAADVTLDDLVLTPVARRELDLAIAWSRHRPDENRLGLACLFTGPSGTGKTTAARAVARAVGLPIYRIDLAQVVNKYIGETEKNLGRLFDEARATSSILFFDEADTLFAKRTEVRDAHDRFANLETGYLLQRLEDHTGIVVLATNLRNNFDPAFARRLQVIVDFAPPGPRERAALWQRMLPRERGTIDIDLLASRFTLTGGDIRNVVTTSLVLAELDQSRLEMRHVIIATWRQLQRSGRLAHGGEFLEWQSDLAPWLAQRSES